MKVNKTTYKKQNKVSREKLANPFSNESIKERLIKSNAIDLSNNQTWIEVGNGYFKSKIIDKTKHLK